MTSISVTMLFRGNRDNHRFGRLILRHLSPLAAAFLVGCAATGTVKSIGVVPPGHQTRHEVVHVETTAENSEQEPQRKILHALVAAGLQQSGRFGSVRGSVATDGPPPDLKVVVKIKDLTRVSDSARMFFGALAGRAGIVADVELTEPNGSPPVAAFQAIGKSSGGWVGAGTTDQAVQKAAEQIIAYIVKAY